MTKKTNVSRRDFLVSGSAAVVGIAVNPNIVLGKKKNKMKVALVGTGIRGNSMWGRSVVREYQDEVEFVGLCDNNPGRLAYGKQANTQLNQANP